MSDGSSSDGDSDAPYGTHISDDETAGKRTRREKLLRAADPEKQAKYQHGHQTEVTDAQGRVRFHGAFTGGFSAGHYNTVGSEEGWAPSEWRSQRDSRGASGGAQRPEDFMDEEDLAALKGPSALVARAGFAKHGTAAQDDESHGASSSAASSSAGAGRGKERHGGGAAAALASLLTVRPRPCRPHHRWLLAKLLLLLLLLLLPTHPPFLSTLPWASPLLLCTTRRRSAV